MVLDDDANFSWRQLFDDDRHFLVSPIHDICGEFERATENEAQEGDEVISEINNEPLTTEEMTDEKEESVVAGEGRVEDELKDAQTQKSANDEAAQESTVDEEDEVIAEVNNGPLTTEKTADEKEGGDQK